MNLTLEYSFHEQSHTSTCQILGYIEGRIKYQSPEFKIFMRSSDLPSFGVEVLHQLQEAIDQGMSLETAFNDAMKGYNN